MFELYCFSMKLKIVQVGSKKLVVLLVVGVSRQRFLIISYCCGNPAGTEFSLAEDVASLRKFLLNSLLFQATSFNKPISPAKEVAVLKFLRELKIISKETQGGSPALDVGRWFVKQGINALSCSATVSFRKKYSIKTSTLKFALNALPQVFSNWLRKYRRRANVDTAIPNVYA